MSPVVTHTDAVVDVHDEYDVIKAVQTSASVMKRRKPKLDKIDRLIHHRSGRVFLPRIPDGTNPPQRLGTQSGLPSCLS